MRPLRSKGVDGSKTEKFGKKVFTYFLYTVKSRALDRSRTSDYRSVIRGPWARSKGKVIKSFIQFLAIQALFDDVKASSVQYFLSRLNVKNYGKLKGHEY